MRDIVDIAHTDGWCGNLGERERPSDATCSTANPKCPQCGHRNTVDTGASYYQEADASRGIPMGEGDEYYCNDCGRIFIW